MMLQPSHSPLKNPNQEQNWRFHPSQEHGQLRHRGLIQYPQMMFHGLSKEKRNWNDVQCIYSRCLVTSSTGELCSLCYLFSVISPHKKTPKPKWANIDSVFLKVAPRAIVLLLANVSRVALASGLDVWMWRIYFMGYAPQISSHGRLPKPQSKDTLKAKSINIYK